MKKPLKLLLAASAAAIGITAVTYGSESLVPLSYLTETFTPQFLEIFEEKADGDELVSDVLSNTGTPLFKEVSLKRQDTVTMQSGSVLVPLTGSLSVSFSGGSVVDATTGEALTSGAAIVPHHRYITAEDTTAVFTVVSDIAVLQCEGSYTFAYSKDTVDYIAMADALKALGLFKGSDTGYGSGYDLDQHPTRLQAIIMFVRMMGEEDEALACTSSHPFTDVPDWGSPYVAYAYGKGYTNGYGNGIFGSNDSASAVSYVEFLLRALGLSTAGVDDYTTALTRAESFGLLTAGERSYLTANDFYRAQVVYLSYTALERPVAGSGKTLGDLLCEKGVFTREALAAAQSGVLDARLP